jgi:signal transduction histidine kinase
MTGYSSAQLSGRHIAELEADGGVEAFERWRVEGFARSKQARRETRWRRRDGGIVAVESVINLVDFDGDRFFISFARDLTERKRLEASLQQADRLASVGSLAAGVAHEINNPLAYVLANLELMAEDLSKLEGAPDRQTRLEFAQTLQEATEGAHRVRRIVGDLKSFARAGEDDEPKPVNLEDVLETAIDIAANEIRHRARLVREYDDVPAVLGNGGRLTQVFLNLLVNAAHAIPEGGRGNQTIAVKTSEKIAGWIRVEVADTGTGMSPDVVDKIFDPFFTTKPQGMGTGLGLSICHGIVAAMGGEIRVRSIEGEGTTFTLDLPAAEGAAARGRAPTWPDVAVESGRRLRILVVDDEPLICEGIRRALSGHEVEVAPSGRDAIRLCEDGEFDLVLCDVMMPDVSGMEVFGRIRIARPAYEQRFVFMTGGAFTPKARAFLESVDNEAIIKPFSLRELRSLVAKHAAHA